MVSTAVRIYECCIAIWTMPFGGTLTKLQEYLRKYVNPHGPSNFQMVTCHWTMGYFNPC